MARKKRKPGRKKRRPRPTFPARFTVGTKVRVKPGTTDPDYPDIPLGGWTGAITEVDQRSNPPLYLIEWDERTLEAMHPVFRSRCARDDVGVESMWLDENDIEPNTGEAATIEQPTNIITRPLNTKDQDDRIRAILGVTSNDPLPETSEETLRTYLNYLTSHLSFPFQGKYAVETGPFQQTEHTVTILALLNDWQKEGGLLCEVTEKSEFLVLPLVALEVTANKQNRQLVDDYTYWFVNYEGEGDSGGNDSPDPETSRLTFPLRPAEPWGFVSSIFMYGICGGIYGAALGILLRVVEWTEIGAGIGALVLALIIGWAGGKYGVIVGPMNRLRSGPVLIGVFGALVGVIAGALIGAAVVALFITWKGAIVGGVAGAVLGKLLRKFKRLSFNPWAVTVLGICIGELFVAVSQNPEQAGFGALYGLLAGGVAAMVLYLASVGTLFLAARR